MPYIDHKLRVMVDKNLRDLEMTIDNVTDDTNVSGVLNYCISHLLVSVIQKKYNDCRYTHLNTMIGVLECVKLELYRRVGAWYEFKCIVKNDDIDPYSKWTVPW